MNRYYYDFHIHSCLSPCADNDMTPNNIAGMAAIAGLQIVALTDHNSAKNCPAFCVAAKKQGLIPIAGMELTTAEDIHVVCLFEEPEEAMSFDAEVDRRRIRIPNRTDIFGEQLVMDENDAVVGTEPDLLPNATDISLEEAPSLVQRHGGICFPAHIDREANGIIATLGTFPPSPSFQIAELHNMEKLEEIQKKHPSVRALLPVGGSDAHYLWDIRDAQNCFWLDDEPYSGALVKKRLFEQLRRGKL